MPQRFANDIANFCGSYRKHWRAICFKAIMTKEKKENLTSKRRFWWIKLSLGDMHCPVISDMQHWPHLDSSM